LKGKRRPGSSNEKRKGATGRTKREEEKIAEEIREKG